MFDLDEELKNLPEEPGVYIMHGDDDTVIYVGKAKILKNRVRQYFQKNSSHTPKVLAMVSNIAYFEYIVTDSETEALALECNLIKKYRPKYNILLKDDKHYPYIKVTINEPYPKVMKVRKLKKDGAKYYGPYVSGITLKNTLELVQKLFKPPSCHRRFPQDIKKGRPCLNYHINNCFAPCTGKVSKEEYRQVYFNICRFLDGNHKELIASLKADMNAAAEKRQYERAADLRDKIRAIQDIEERQKIINTAKQDNRDVIALAREDTVAFCEVFFIRSGKVIGHENYKIDNTRHSSESEILTDFVKQFYQTGDAIPDEILTEYEIEDREAIAEWLRSIKNKKVAILSPKRGDKLHMVEMVKKNADIVLGNYKIKVMKEREKNTLLDAMQELLGLSKRPMRIEAYDISNTQGADNVGGMVVFENGKSAKRKYRIFKIKSFEGADDYAAMREVIYRRFRHALDEEEMIKKGEILRKDAKFLPLPDLILLDGGKGHLNVITELMEMMDSDIPVFGMVKNDKHKTRGLVSDSGEIEISPTSPVFKLITHIQDEVHNTAITYHRKLRGKIESELDKISGIGEKRRKALLTNFTSVDKIKEADIETLMSVKEMDRKSAEAVFEYFHRGNNV
ncbi:excinuclease ABC subunit UvrC [Lachnospiraceae bacterium MD329]|nr:excinuclease ABC subunit UvrC [Lachnospiraceae bacterium MD329]